MSLREKLGFPEPRFMTAEQKRLYANACATQFRKNNPEKFKAIRKRHYVKNRETVLARTQEWRLRNIEHLKDYGSRRYDNPVVRAKARERYNAYVKRRRLDPAYRILANQRARLWELAKSNRACKSVTLGLSAADIRATMEQHFLPGMTWDNYGKEWHIDHVIPCCEFDLTKPDQIKKCFGLANLRPLWAKDNLKKNRYLPKQAEFPLAIPTLTQ